MSKVEGKIRQLPRVGISRELGAKDSFLQVSPPAQRPRERVWSYPDMGDPGLVP